MGYYYTGQACLNGHAITGNAGGVFSAKFCSDCGKSTITRCPSCDTTLRGTYSESFSTRAWRPSAHCEACGEPYPWTAAKLTAVQELAEAIEELTDHERDVLMELLPHLVQETPRTQPAGFKAATIVGKIAGPGRIALRKILEEVAVEAGKKALGL